MSIVISFLISASFFASKTRTKITESFVRTVKSPTQLKSCIAEEGGEGGDNANHAFRA